MRRIQRKPETCRMARRPIIMGSLIALLALARSVGAQVQEPANPAAPDTLRPPVLNRPLETLPERLPPALPVPPGPLLQTPVDPPLGFTGPSRGSPRARARKRATSFPWKIGGALASRPGIAPARGTRSAKTQCASARELRNPYRQNVLKGDYPIIGQAHLPRMSVPPRR